MAYTVPGRNAVNFALSAVTPSRTANFVFAPPSGGSLSGSSVADPLVTTVDISSMGFNDWAIVNTSGAGGAGIPASITMRKNGGGSTITTSGMPNSFDTTVPPKTISWSDGTPTTSGSEVSGGFTMQGDTPDTATATFPATTTLRRAIIWYPYYRYDAISTLKVTASLSDNSAPSIAFDGISPVASNSVEHGYLVFDYSASGTGQVLTVNLRAQGTGPWDNIGIQALGWMDLAGDYVYLGNGFSVRYPGARSETAIYFGARTLHA